MYEFRFVKGLSRFKSAFTKMDIDLEAVQKILTLKLTMDQRRVPSFLQSQMKVKEGNNFLKSLWLYTLYGAVLIPFILLDLHLVFQMSIVFGMTMFILMTSMISDFSGVLLDVRDIYILQTKPVTRRTISAAKILHVIYYMSFVSASFILLPFFVGLFRNGIFFSLLFLFLLLFIMLFVVVITAFTYLIILRIFDGERLKDMINGVQILLSVGVIIGYQVMVRSFDIFSLEIVYSFSWWHVFIPPIWFSGAFELIYNQLFTMELVILTSIAIIVPILLLFIYSKVMPSFERNLEKLLSDLRQGKKKEKRLQSFLARIVCRSKEEQDFYRFAATLMKQERGFKLKVYPAIAMSIVFPFIFVLGERRLYTFEELGMGNLFFVVYFCNLLIPTVVHMLKFSDHAEGSWIFGTAPIRQKSAFYSGALKAMLVGIYLPTVFLVSVAFTIVFSYQIIPSLIAIFFNGVLQTVATYKIINNEIVPFSKPFSFAQDSDTARMIILLLITGLFILPHLIALTINNGIYVYLAIQLLAIWISWRTMFPIRGR